MALGAPHDSILKWGQAGRSQQRHLSASVACSVRTFVYDQSSTSDVACSPSLPHMLGPQTFRSLETLSHFHGVSVSCTLNDSSGLALNAVSTFAHFSSLPATSAPRLWAAVQAGFFTWRSATSSTHRSVVFLANFAQGLANPLCRIFLWLNRRTRPSLSHLIMLCWMTVRCLRLSASLQTPF
ncbi:hypothetical protein R1flu_025480 [Riccia fluitans]|uniref:Uncharacterized protein n=1 Tax=Riccia fluitans TaxID=41844 RepID=A0ABD1XYR6_9MARC